MLLRLLLAKQSFDPVPQFAAHFPFDARLCGGNARLLGELATQFVDAEELLPVETHGKARDACLGIPFAGSAPLGCFLGDRRLLLGR